MSPFENIIQGLSTQMEVTLHPDSHQSCVIHFPAEDLIVQIDLDTDADKILVGSELGRINPGSFRERVFLRALQTNGTAKTASGTLAFSEKNDTLILFQFLSLQNLSAEALYAFLQVFKEKGTQWKQALFTGELPTIQPENAPQGNRMLGLR